MRLTAQQTNDPAAAGAEAAAVKWENELAASIDRLSSATTMAEREAALAALPSLQVLRARARHARTTLESTLSAAANLRAHGAEYEGKLRRLVALCTGLREEEVDAAAEGLERAVESEKTELEIPRVRRFLGNMDAVVSAGGGAAGAGGAGGGGGASLEADVTNGVR